MIPSRSSRNSKAPRSSRAFLYRAGMGCDDRTSSAPISFSKADVCYVVFRFCGRRLSSSPHGTWLLSVMRTPIAIPSPSDKGAPPSWNGVVSSTPKRSQKDYPISRSRFARRRRYSRQAGRETIFSEELATPTRHPTLTRGSTRLACSRRHDAQSASEIHRRLQLSSGNKKAFRWFCLALTCGYRGWPIRTSEEHSGSV